MTPKVVEELKAHISEELKPIKAKIEEHEAKWHKLDNKEAGRYTNCPNRETIDQLEHGHIELKATIKEKENGTRLLIAVVGVLLALINFIPK